MQVSKNNNEYSIIGISTDDMVSLLSILNAAYEHSVMLYLEDVECLMLKTLIVDLESA